MIPGGMVRPLPRRCERRTPHRTHRWVTDPQSEVDYQCPGRTSGGGTPTADVAELVIELGVSAA